MRWPGFLTSLKGAAWGVAVTTSVGCGAGSAGVGSVGPGSFVDEANLLRTTLAARDRDRDPGPDIELLAPKLFAEANAELALAQAARTTGDALGGELHGERAFALYQQSVAGSRFERASKDLAMTSHTLADASSRARTYAAQRVTLDREADDLEKRLRVAREADLPLASGPADPERERARRVAAESLLTQAHLLCGAARLASPQAPGLEDAEAAVTRLAKQVGFAKVGPTIDLTARARAACLMSLAKGQRGHERDSDPSDGLLNELAQGAATAKGTASGLEPARDERGVVVTLRGLFASPTDAQLTPEADASIRALGRVAAAHREFAVQIVVHDSKAPSPQLNQANQKRGEAVARAFTSGESGGIDASRVKVEQAGSMAPVVDPNDSQRRERNARVEFVFVASTR